MQQGPYNEGVTVARKDRMQGRAILIGGVGRSGTTLARSLLNKHREIAAFGETQLASWRVFREFPEWVYECPPGERRPLLEVFQRLCLTRFYCYRTGWPVNPMLLALWLAWDRMWLCRFYRFRSAWNRNLLLRAVENLWLSDALQQRTFGRKPPDGRTARLDFGMRGLWAFFAREEIEQCFPLLRQLENANTLHEVYRAYGTFWTALFGLYARSKGKRYWAEKTPTNVQHVPFFARCFEDLRILNVVRDGRDVACSWARMPWRVRDPVRILDRWGAQLTKALQDLRNLPDEHYLNVRYEDLILRTEPTLHRVTEFLNIEWDSNMLAAEVYDTSIGRFNEELVVCQGSFSL